MLSEKDIIKQLKNDPAIQNKIKPYKKETSEETSEAEKAKRKVNWNLLLNTFIAPKVKETIKYNLLVEKQNRKNAVFNENDFQEMLSNNEMMHRALLSNYVQALSQALHNTTPTQSSMFETILFMNIFQELSQQLSQLNYSCLYDPYMKTFIIYL